MAHDAAHPAPPAPHVLEALLDRVTDFTAPPLLPELRVFQARSLVEVWAAAEEIAGAPLPSPFWAYAWPAGVALARVILDAPERVRGARVLDVGAGGGVTALAIARAGAARVVANDVDPWALATARLAATRQGLAIATDDRDLTFHPEVVRDFDVVIASDLLYEKHAAPRQRALLDAARTAGADVLVADAERTYFDATGLTELARFDIRVPTDLEGVDVRQTIVFTLGEICRPGRRSRR